MLRTKELSFILQALGAVLIMATIPVVIKAIHVDPYTIAFVRLLIAVLAGSFIFLRIRDLVTLSRSDWLSLMLIGSCFALHWYLYFLSIKVSNASLAVIGVSSYGVQIIIISVLFHGRPIQRTDIISIASVLLGSYFVIPEFSIDNELTYGFFIAVLSGFFYALLPSLHQRSKHLGSKTRAYGQFFLALICFLPFLGEMNFEMPIIDWAAMFYLGLVCTLLAHTLWINVTTYVSAVVSSLLYYLMVPLAVILSAIFLDEPLTMEVIFGTACILGGNLIGMIKNLKKNQFFLNSSQG